MRPSACCVREGATGPAAILLQYLDFGHERRAACHLPPSYALWFSRLLNEGGVSGPRQVTMAADLDRQASIAEVKDLPRFDMSRVTVRRAGFDFWSLVADEEAKAEAAGRRSFQVLISLGDAEGAAAVEMLRGWGYACSGLSPNYLEDGQHAAIMYRCFAEPYFEGIQLHNAAALRLLDNVMADWRRAERLGAELRHAFDDQSAETPTPAPLPPLPDSPRSRWRPPCSSSASAGVCRWRRAAWCRSISAAAMGRGMPRRPRPRRPVPPCPRRTPPTDRRCGSVRTFSDIRHLELPG
jgi:hypothetical protein